MASSHSLILSLAPALPPFLAIIRLGVCRVESVHGESVCLMNKKIGNKKRIGIRMRLGGWVRVSEGYEAGGDKKCKNSPESCVSGKLKCERASGRGKER